MKLNLICPLTHLPFDWRLRKPEKGIYTVNIRLHCIAYPDIYSPYACIKAVTSAYPLDGSVCIYSGYV